MDDVTVGLFTLVVLLAGAFLALWRWEIGRGSRRAHARVRAARRGEADAEVLLERLGFAIVDRQVTGAWSMRVDDEDVDVACRADLLVERDARTYVAEVKTGALAPDPTRPATRRQLLEYRFVFDVDGVLLVDMASRTVCEVVFPDTG